MIELEAALGCSVLPMEKLRLVLMTAYKRNVISDSNISDAPPYVTISYIYDKVGEYQDHLYNDYGITDDSRPRFAGSATPNTIVTLYDGDTVIGSAVVGSDGYWSIIPEVPLADGYHELKASVGDGGPFSTDTYNMSVNTSDLEPGKLVINSAYDHVSSPYVSYVQTNEVSKDNRPMLEGTAKPGEVVTILDGANNPIGSVKADEYGNWKFTPVAPLADGSHSLVAQTASGQSSEPFVVNIDSSPIPPTFNEAYFDDVGQAGSYLSNTTTDDAQPEFSGNAAPWSIITIYDGANNPIGSTQSDRWGHWKFQPETPLSDGTHNLYAESPEGLKTGIFVVHVDTTPAPTISSTFYDDVGIEGHYNSGETTDDARPTLQGTAAVNSIVTIRDAADNVIGSAKVDGYGKWTFTPEQDLADGRHQLHAVTEDGQSTGEIVIVVDVSGPAPVILYGFDDVGQMNQLYSGSSTDDAKPTLSGRGTANSTLMFYSGDNQLIGSVKVGPTGFWEFTPTQDLADGRHELKVVDSHGQSSEVFVLTVETGVPAPVIEYGYDDVGQHQHLYSGITTDDTRPRFEGTGQPNAIVYIKDGADNTIGSARADQNGRWVFTPIFELADGEHRLTAVDEDGQSSIEFVVNIDTRGEAPSITHGYDDVACQQYLYSGNTTDDTRPTLSGTGVAHSILFIRDAADKLIGSVKVGPYGQWDFTPEQDLADGRHELRVVDSNGQSSAGFVINVDSKGAAPVIHDGFDDVGQASHLYSGSTTDDTRPTLYGTGAANVTLYIRDAADNLIGSVKVDSYGRWEFTPEQDLADGLHELRAVDSHGQSSAVFVVNIDTTGPAPVILEGFDDVGQGGHLYSGSTTDDTRPTLSGTGVAGTVLFIRDTADNVIGSVKVGPYGHWDFTPEQDLADGRHELRAVDSHGQSSAVFVVNVDSKGPAPVILQAFDDVGQASEIYSGTITDDTRPTLSGTGVAGTVLFIRDTADNVIGSVKVGPYGHWDFTPEQDLADGRHELRAVDSHGQSSAVFVVNVDSKGPAPVILQAFDDVGQASEIYSGTITDDTRPTLSGTGVAGTVLFIRDTADNVIGSVKVGPYGHWDFTPEQDLADGRHELRAVDSHGQSSAVFVVNVDSKGPAPVILQAFDDVGQASEIYSGTITDDTRPTLSGTGVAGTVLFIRDTADNVIGSVKVGPYGHWDFTPEQDLADGRHELRAVDSHGQSSAVFVINVDSTGPAPVILYGFDDVGQMDQLFSGSTTDDTKPTLSGTGVANSTLMIYDGATKLIGSVKVGSSGYWEFTPEQDLADGRHELHAVDSHGQNSGAFVINVDTRDPAPVITHGYDDAGIPQMLDSGVATDDVRPTLYGTAVTGSVVFIYDGNTLLGSAKAGDGGTWNFTPDEDLTDGRHQLFALDANGQTSNGFVLEIDSNGLPPEIFRLAYEDGGRTEGYFSSGQTIDDTQPLFRGYGQPGTTLTIHDGLNNPIGTAKVDSNGNWTFTPEKPLLDGPHNLIAVDAHGQRSDGFKFTLDTDPQVRAPEIGFAKDDVGPYQPFMGSGRATDDTQPEFHGKGEPRSTITIFDNGLEIGTARCDARGNWSFTPDEPLPLGDHSFTVKAGNGPESEAFLLNLHAPLSSYSLPENLSLEDVVSTGESELFAAAQEAQPVVELPELDADAFEGVTPAEGVQASGQSVVALNPLVQEEQYATAI
ncbi:Ig-like domain-containing protein [Pseudomonas fluorescens]|uniref:Ig-like domain-containing protein n=1 Tax=Pseudomonas fluorescens TaxID=294 RepID=UPI001A9F3644|nr:Ig-like domain-containing protein [Pseudomonas fluorescens]QTD31464.1 hypothetical protein JZM58_19435 [Pseudomonas fluorescens]